MLMIAMAAIVIPFNSGGVGFLVYAAAVGGFTVKFRWAVATLAVELAILAYYSMHLHLDVGTWGSMTSADHFGGDRQPSLGG